MISKQDKQNYKTAVHTKVTFFVQQQKLTFIKQEVNLLINFIQGLLTSFIEFKPHSVALFNLTPL